MKKNVVYVEDEEDFQMLVARLLGAAGLEIRIAGTGAEGMALIQKKRPDLVILDVNLPDANGYDLCKRLRRDTAWSDLPILMLTVRRRPEEWLKGFASGADDYVSKPLNPPELIERVESCLEVPIKRTIAGVNPEKLLINAALAGNRAAFAVLIEQYKVELRDSLLPKTDSLGEAEDIVAAAFMKAFDLLSRFRGDSTFYSWLYRIAHHEFNRRRRNVPERLDDLIETPNFTPPSDRLDEGTLVPFGTRSEQVELAKTVLQKLPQKYRELLELSIIHEKSYEEIASTLNIPIGTVMSRLSTAKRMMKEVWDEALNPQGQRSAS